MVNFVQSAQDVVACTLLDVQHASQLQAEKLRNMCFCTPWWIYVQPMMIDPYFKFLNTLPVKYESLWHKDIPIVTKTSFIKFALYCDLVKG